MSVRSALLSPAQSAGVHQGDLITAVNGSKVADAQEVISAVGECGGESVCLGLQRGSKSMSINVTPVQSGEGEWLLGIWLRDGLSGLGTLTFCDPDSGVFQKGEHRKCFAYEAHTVCDRRSYVLEAEVTPGNVHDSVVFDRVFDRLVEHYPEVQVITADAGYKTPWICKQVFDSGRIPSLPYKRPMTKKGNLP